MDVADIQRLAVAQLTSIGIGPRYTEGLIHAAHQELMTEGNPSVHAQLIEIGHSHSTSTDLTELVESVFFNTHEL